MYLCLLGLVAFDRSSHAFCSPEGLVSNPDQAMIVEQLLVLPDGPEPSVILRCGFASMPGLQRVTVGLSRTGLAVSPIEWDPAWEALWTETSPLAVQWTPPTNVRATPAESQDPIVRAVTGLATRGAPVRESSFLLQDLPVPVDPDQPATDATSGTPSPAAPARGLFTLSRPATSEDSFFWLDPIRIPLITGEDPGPIIPLVEVTAPDQSTPPPQRDISLLIVSAGRYLGVSSISIEEAMDQGLFSPSPDPFPQAVEPDSGEQREVDSRATGEASPLPSGHPAPEPAAEPGPEVEPSFGPGVSSDHWTFVLPDLRLRVTEAGFADFDAFHRRRLSEISARIPGNLAVLEYMGPLDTLTRTGRRVPAFDGAPAGLDRALRVRLLGRLDRELPLTAVPEAWFESTWIQLLSSPSTPTERPRPRDLSLSDEALLFSFGAEPPAELTEGLVLEVIYSNLVQVSRCDPGLAIPVSVEMALVVEPGGSTLAVLARSVHPSTARCMVDVFRAMPFMVATGPPISIRFPLEFDARQ